MVIAEAAWAARGGERPSSRSENHASPVVGSRGAVIQRAAAHQD